MKNRTVLGILCIILAIGLMFGVSPFINRITSGKITVCQVNRKISQGQMITVDDIVKVEIGSYGVKEGVIKNEEQLVGKYANANCKFNCPPYITSYIKLQSDLVICILIFYEGNCSSNFQCVSHLCLLVFRY